METAKIHGISSWTGTQLSRFAASPPGVPHPQDLLTPCCVSLGRGNSVFSHHHDLLHPSGCRDLPGAVPFGPSVAAASPGNAVAAAGTFPGAAAVGLSGRLVLMASVAAGGTGNRTGWNEHLERPRHTAPPWSCWGGGDTPEVVPQPPWGGNSPSASPAAQRELAFIAHSQESN